MSAKPTPGPWHIDEDGNIVSEIGCIAIVYRDNIHTGPPEESANARVMAAAPLMLEVCRAVLERGHYDTCSAAFGRYPCSCPYGEAEKATAAADGVEMNPRHPEGDP